MDETSKKEAEEAFLAAYDEYADPIYRFCLRKVSDQETARDLMQDTFTKTWDYYREGKEIQSWKHFLYRTAYNLIVDTYRKRKSESLDVLYEGGFTLSDAGEGSVTAKAELSRVIAGINALGEKYRDVVLFRFVEGLPPREIAEIMNISENIVSVRLHRGLKKLRDQFPEYEIRQ